MEDCSQRGPGECPLQINSKTKPRLTSFTSNTNLKMEAASPAPEGAASIFIFLFLLQRLISGVFVLSLSAETDQGHEDDVL